LAEHRSSSGYPSLKGTNGNLTVGIVIKLSLDNHVLDVDDDTTVAAVILNAEKTVFRTSVSGELRGPLCGMGICFECRVTINGIPHQRSCTRTVEDEMEVVTGG